MLNKRNGRAGRAAGSKLEKRNQMWLVGQNRIAVALMIVATLLSSVAGITARAFDNSNAGTVISNRAEATYENEAGESFSTTSEIVTVTVMAVAALAVTPDDTAPSNTL